MAEPEDDVDDADEEESPEPPPAKKKKRRPTYVEASSEREKTWSSMQVLLFVLVALAVGGFGGYTARGSGKAKVDTSAEAAPAETVAGPRVDPSAVAPAAPAAGADKFGRPPGDEHFGHDHPPGQQGAPAAPAPAPGPDGKDSFGRAPGSEHFGHNHP